MQTQAKPTALKVPPNASEPEYRDTIPAIRTWLRSDEKVQAHSTLAITNASESSRAKKRMNEMYLRQLSHTVHPLLAANSTAFPSPLETYSHTYIFPPLKSRHSRFNALFARVDSDTRWSSPTYRSVFDMGTLHSTETKLMYFGFAGKIEEARRI